MVNLGSGSEREIDDILLTRYGCYLIAQNSDPRKEAVALAQTYFAVKTRERELTEAAFNRLSEDQKHLAIRQNLHKHNSARANTAHNAGVDDPRDYTIFQNHGYRGLYGGLISGDIHKRKRLKKSQHILDHMGRTELAANLFCATQTEEKIAP